MTFGADCIRALMRKGLDTADIAQRIGVSEAQIWNLLARDGSAPRQTVRLAHVRAPSLTSPAAAAVGGPFPVVVRNQGGKAQGVDQINLASDVSRQASALVVHRFGSGGIGPQ